MKRMRTFTAVLMAVCMLVSMVTTAFADYNGTGTGNVGDSGGTWMDVSHSGYRVTITETDGLQVASKDVLFSTPPGSPEAHVMKANKIGGQADNAFVTAPLGMPMPITYSGGTLYGNGAELRRWMNGADGSGMGADAHVGAFIQSVFGSSISSTFQAKTRKMIIEPILWFTPRANASLNYVTLSQKVYGTVSNLADFHYMYGYLLGNDIGGTMADLTNRVGATALFITEPEDFAEPGKSFSVPSIHSSYYSASDILFTGLAMHVYKNKVDGTHTWDYALGNTPGAAPIPPAPDTPGTTNTIRIIKMYFNEVDDGHGGKVELPVGIYNRQSNGKRCGYKGHLQSFVFKAC